MPPGSKFTYPGLSAQKLPRRRQRAARASCTARGNAPAPCTGRFSHRRMSLRGPWPTWMRYRGHVSGPAVFLPWLWAEADLPQQLVCALAAGEVGGASGNVAPVGRESEVMTGHTRERMVSSAVVVQKAKARSMSPLERVARHAASSGSRRH